MIKTVLVTGSKGFIGRHMVKALLHEGYEVIEFDSEDPEERLDEDLKRVDFVVHLAGSNRPMSNAEYYMVNSDFTCRLIKKVKATGKQIPIVYSSSIQAELTNDYGRSKKEAEEHLFNSGLPVYVFRLSNVFGKWCKPYYNSVVATYCQNLAVGEPLYVRQPDFELRLNYIDDVVETFLDCVKGNTKPSQEILSISTLERITLGDLESKLRHFYDAIESDEHLPKISTLFDLRLFVTLCDYLRDQFMPLNEAYDERGYFKEIYKSKQYGQISVNMAHPGITKGGHYHTYKHEKFETVIGKTITRLRKIDSKAIEEYKSPAIVDINPMYTHDITNVGEEDSLTLMWVDTPYSEESPDTYRQEVEIHE